MAAKQATLRPLSGEIMTEAVSAQPRAAWRAHAATDADFTVVAAEPVSPERPSMEAASAVASAGMEMLRKGVLGTPDAGGSRNAGPLFWAIGVLIAAASFWAAGGHALLPRPAALAEPLLRIENLRTAVRPSDAIDVLFIDGEIVNAGGVSAAAPALEMTVRDLSGGTIRYSLGSGQSTIAPAGRFAFASRLPAPASGVSEVAVRIVGGKSGE